MVADMSKLGIKPTAPGENPFLAAYKTAEANRAKLTEQQKAAQAAANAQRQAQASLAFQNLQLGAAESLAKQQEAASKSGTAIPLPNWFAELESEQSKPQTPQGGLVPSMNQNLGIMDPFSAALAQARQAAPQDIASKTDFDKALGKDESKVPWIVGGIAALALVGGGVYLMTRKKRR